MSDIPTNQLYEAFKALSEQFSSKPKCFYCVHIDDLLPILRETRKLGYVVNRVPKRAIWRISAPDLPGYLLEFYVDTTRTLTRGKIYGVPIPTFDIYRRQPLKLDFPEFKFSDFSASWRYKGMIPTPLISNPMKDFVEAAQREIAQAFGVPPELLQRTDPTSSSAKQAYAAQMPVFTHSARLLPSFTFKDPYLEECRAKFSPKIYHNIERRVHRQRQREWRALAPKLDKLTQQFLDKSMIAGGYQGGVLSEVSLVPKGIRL